MKTIFRKKKPALGAKPDKLETKLFAAKGNF